MKRTFTLLTAGLLCSQAVMAQDTQMGTPNFLMIPQENVQVAPRGGYELRYNDNGGFFEMRYFGPIEQNDKSWWLVDGAMRGHFSDDDIQNYSGHVGVVYREQIKKNTMIGTNAYIDTLNDGQRSYNQASAGVEYEKRNPDNNSYMQAGANHYLPFEDYTNRDRFGELGTAPRRGTDAYISIGKDYDGYGVRGSVTGFHYNETQHAKPLSGARADLDIEYTRNLPEGMRLHAGLGMRQDNMTDSKPEAEVSFGMTWTLGMNKLRKRDACEVARDGKENPKIDCTEQVQPTGTTLTTKTGQTILNDVPTRRVSLTPPRRNIAYGSPAVPIEYKRSKTTLELVKRTTGGNGRFTFTSNAPLPMALTTKNNVAQSGAVDVRPGSYTIRETDIPDGWTFDRVRCVGASGINGTQNGVSLLIQEGDKTVCTFFNTFSETPPPPETATLRIAKTISTPGAPGGVFTFTSSEPKLNTSISVAETGITAMGPLVEVEPDTYTLTETNLPEQFSLENVSCSGGNVDHTTMGVKVTLNAGDNVVCTFTNSYETLPEITAPIAVITSLNGVDFVTLPETTFTYATNFDHTYTMTTPESDGFPFSQTFADGPGLPAGSYRITVDSVSENAFLQSVRCDNVLTQNTFLNGVEITIDALVNPTCTFNFFLAPINGANDNPQNTLGISQRASTNKTLKVPSSPSTISAAGRAENPWEKKNIVQFDKNKTHVLCQTTDGHKRFGSISAPGRPSRCAQ